MLVTLFLSLAAAIPCVPAERTSPVALVTEVVAVDAGGPGFANWKPDSGSPSFTLHTKASVNTAGVDDPAPQAIYRTQRFFDGQLVYSMAGLQPRAAYAVRLHFVEFVKTGPGQRVFNVSINGRREFSNFDVFAEAGGRFRAIVERFGATADADGQIGIVLTPVHDDPIISAVEIQRANGVRVVVLNGGDSEGRWVPLLSAR